MIKRFTILLLAAMLLISPLPLAAQSTLTEIESMAVEIWPDYDDTAVLVLLTGFLPPETSYPATLTIPLPENTDVNAVAYITEENAMTDKGVEYEIVGNELILTSSDPGFRVEFYIPYSADGLDREFSYTWQNMNTAVNDLRILVQEPLAASELSTIPNTATATPGNDGLTYHTILAQAVAAGEPFTVNVAYTMSSEELTANLLNNQTSVTASDSAPPPTTSTPEASTSSNLNWPLILAGFGFFLIVIAGIWQIATKRANGKPAKPQQKRQTARSTKANFCRQCGTKLQPSDKFCRDCGTAVKQ